MGNLLGLVTVVFFVVPFLGLPLLIFFTNKAKAQFNTQPVDLEQVLHTAQDWMRTQERAVNRLGFRTDAILRNTDTYPNVASFMILLSRRDTSERAMIAATYSIDSTGYTLGSRSVEFLTRFDDESEVNTNNVATPAVFAPDPMHPTYRLPQVDDPAVLYHVHQYVVSKHAVGKSRWLPPAGGEVAALQKAVRESYQRQIRHGRLRYDPTADIFRPTLAGAFLMTWPMLPPIKQIQLFLRRLQASTLLREVQSAARIA